jgi:predicted nucleic acid-binding protein
MLFDTDIFIWIQKGIPEAADVMDAAGNNACASLITYMEFLHGSPDRKTLRLNKSFFQAASIALLPITAEISYRASHYVEQFCVSHSMHPNDALIAATAVESGLTLVTGNGKHYRQLKELDLRVLKLSEKRN